MIWWLPSFFAIPALQECISTHKVRAQLDIRDVILRGLGMCLQQANSVRVITKALLANLRSNNDCGLNVPPMKGRMKDMNKENNSIEKEMIVADDITDIQLIQAGYYWEMGFNEFDFTCKIKGEDDVLHMREQRQDDGSGFVIHSEKDDIWERITRIEACKLDDKLQEAIQYGNYHKRIAGLTTVEDCKDLEFELMENNNVYLNRVIKKIWSELAAKQEEIAGIEPDVVTEFRRKTDEMFHRIDGMSVSEIEGIVSDYVQSKIDENNLEVDVIGVIVSGSRCRGIKKAGSDLDVVLEYKGSIREDTFFDILHEDGMEIGGVKVDINPITEGKTGTLESYLPAVEEYPSQKQIEREKRKSVRQNIKEKKAKNPIRKEKRKEGYDVEIPGLF